MLLSIWPHVKPTSQISFLHPCYFSLQLFLGCELVPNWLNLLACANISLFNVCLAWRNSSWQIKTWGTVWAGGKGKTDTGRSWIYMYELKVDKVTELINHYIMQLSSFFQPLISTVYQSSAFHSSIRIFGMNWVESSIFVMSWKMPSPPTPINVGSFKSNQQAYFTTATLGWGQGQIFKVRVLCGLLCWDKFIVHIFMLVFCCCFL